MWPDLDAVRDGIIFNILNMIAGILWTIDRIMMMVAAILHWFRVLLVGGGGQDNLLGILMTQLLQGNELLKQLVYLGIMLAFTVLAFTLIARPLIGAFQAVEFNKVILWFFIAVIIFSAGPGMVSGLESTRLGLQEQAHLIASTINYQNEVNRFNNQVVPNTVGDFWLPGQTPGYVPHLFGTAVGSDCPSGCNGLDAAAAFLGAEEGDITGARAGAQNTGGYPQALYDRYFTWRDGNAEERAASVRNASDGVMRLLEGILPAFFSIIEAVIFLLFGIAALVLFISLPVAIPFAFFSLTEIIAASVVRAYLFLVIRTFVVATMMAFLVQMLIIFAERGTVLVFVSIAALTMLLSFQFVHMAASTVTGALNVIGSAVGSATGMSVRQTDPFAAAGRVAGMAALAGAAVATGGGAMVGAAALLHRQGGLRGGGLSAVGSAALHAARVRAGAAVGRTPLAGLQRGYSAVQGYHQRARDHAYQLETARALLLDRDAEDAAAVLMGQKNAVSPQRREWARKKVHEWRSAEGSRQQYRVDMRAAGLGRLGSRGYSRPWKALQGGNDATQPEASSRGTATNSELGPDETAHMGGPTSAAGADPNGLTDQRAVHGTLGTLGTPGAGESTSTGTQGGKRQNGQGGGNPAGLPSASATGGGGGGGGGRKPGTVKGAGNIGNITSATNASATKLPDGEGEPYIATMLRFKANDSSVRAAADEAVVLENRAVALIEGYLVVYSGARSEDDPRVGRQDRYDLVPSTADILDLLQKGKHVQKSRKRPGFLVSWELDPGQASTGSSGLSALTLWSGADRTAGRQVLSDVRELADRFGRGLPLNASSLQGRLSHLSFEDRQRFATMLQEGAISSKGMLSVLEAAGEVADSAGSIDGVDGAIGVDGVDDPQVVLDNFVGPNGYLDLTSPGVASVLSLAASRGGAVAIQLSNSQDIQEDRGNRGDRGVPGIPAADMALLISAGLGLKRTLPWAQVKGAIVAASISDVSDPVRAVSEDLGAPSLRTSTAPIKRFVETAHHMGLSATDLSTTLDVATTTRDMAGVIAAISEKDETNRHARWRTAGVPEKMLRPLDRVRSNALREVSRRSPVSLASPAGSPDGGPDHKVRERADEMLGTLLAEGMTISDELYSVPIETYSAHPFTTSALPAAAPSTVPAALPASASASTPATPATQDVVALDAPTEPGEQGKRISPAPGAPKPRSPGGVASKRSGPARQGNVNNLASGPASSTPVGGPEYREEAGGTDESNERN